jgi:hypothetical protein
MNNVQNIAGEIEMQLLLIERMAFTFVGDARALLTGFRDIVAGLFSAPIDRIARSCDFTGGYAQQRKSEQNRKQMRRRLSTLGWRHRRTRLLDRINPFCGMRNLT